MISADVGEKLPPPPCAVADDDAKATGRGKSLRFTNLLALLLLIAGIIYVQLSHADTTSSADWPRTFGFGETASKKQIDDWNIDVMPDGSGLPPGSGTATAGKSVYLARCQSCHGEEGKGGSSGDLVRQIANDEFPFSHDRNTQKTIGNYWPFATTIYDYINRAMPYEAPGSLDVDNVYALTAYLLFLNGIITENTVIDSQTLPHIVMPAKQRFVADAPPAP